ncbi:DUF3199 family protein [Domibacillus indicus]
MAQYFALLNAGETLTKSKKTGDYSYTLSETNSSTMPDTSVCSKCL